MLRKLWHHLPTDINTKGNTFEEHLAWEVHVLEIGYLREKHRIGKPDPERLALYLRSWEQLKAEYEKFMAKKAARAAKPSGTIDAVRFRDRLTRLFGAVFPASHDGATPATA